MTERGQLVALLVPPTPAATARERVAAHDQRLRQAADDAGLPTCAPS